MDVKDLAGLDQLLEEEDLICYLLEGYLIYHPNDGETPLLSQML